MEDRAKRPGSLRIIVATAMAMAVVAAVVLAGSVASAHVTVTPGSVAQGGFEILSFSVPNEKDDAGTIGLEVEVPTKHPIAFVSVKPMTGWSIATEKTALAKPVKGENGDITEAVSRITWTATAGGLEPGQFDLFTISAGPLPTKATKLTFKVLQTYSDGEVVRWIQPAVKGAPEPEFPAPTLKLTKASSDGGH